MQEKVFNLFDLDFGNIRDLVYVLVSFGNARNRDNDPLLIPAHLIFHFENTDWPGCDDRTRYKCPLSNQEGVDWVAVRGKGVRDKPVVARVTH